MSAIFNNTLISQAAQAMANTQIANGTSLHNIIQTFQQLINQNIPKKKYTFNMNISDIKQIVTDRLNKLNLKLEDLQTEPNYNGKCIAYQGLRMETLPNMRKQYCYSSDGWFSGELLLGLSNDSKRPCLIACNLDDVETEFMREGNIKASSTYIKVPLSYRLFRSNELWNFALESCCGNYVEILTTPEEINAWFDKFEAYLPRVIAQGKMCADVLAYIKTNGKPFKETMKKYAKRDKEWKEARNNYENMILQQIARITKLDKISDDF